LVLHEYRNFGDFLKKLRLESCNFAYFRHYFYHLGSKIAEDGLKPPNMYILLKTTPPERLNATFIIALA